MLPVHSTLNGAGNGNVLDQSKLISRSTSTSAVGRPSWRYDNIFQAIRWSDVVMTLLRRELPAADYCDREQRKTMVALFESGRFSFAPTFIQN